MSTCIEWKGRRRRGGYGYISRNGGSVYAHREAWSAVYGAIPSGMEILHSCDNPGCVNVDHLRIGTHAENMRDKAVRGRSVGRGRPIGSMHEAHPLREVRISNKIPLRDVAKAAGVSIASLSAWERGTRTPKDEHLRRWKRALR